MKNRNLLFLLASSLIVLAIACQAADGFGIGSTPTPLPPTPVPTPLPPIAVVPGEANPNEPVLITGDIPYTSPFFLNDVSEPFILLEDQAGFIRRDLNFEFTLSSQDIGPVIIHEDKTLTYSLSLPSVPQGTQVDLDNDGETERGVQVFAVSYWSNIWGGPFLEKRDGTGWSTAYASTITDPERENEIKGGQLIVWAPDAEQSFPTGFGEDNQLFTEDDPSAPIPAGYNVVDLDQVPFRVYKEANPQITLVEGDIAVNDYSDQSYSAAFEAMFAKVSVEYPFTLDKDIDWQALHDQIAPEVEDANSKEEFYRALRKFTWAIPDAHVGLDIDPDVFYEECGGGFGMILTELSDGRVLVTQVNSGSPAAKAGLQVGAELVTWNSRPVGDEISKVLPYFGPSSTEHHKRMMQVVFLTRMPPNTRVNLSYKNPGDSQEKTAELRAVVEYDSLFDAIPTLSQDQLIAPIEGRVLDSGLGYIRINTFSDDYGLMSRLWEHFIQSLIENEVPGLIIDMRSNQGGSGGMAMDFAGYFFDQEIEVSQEFYYNEVLGQFEAEPYVTRLSPGPVLYAGPVAVLVSPDCVSACEGFVNAMTQDDRAQIVGSYPTAGAFGEVGRGQYTLPEDISLQFPTGRPETLDGELLIEGSGVKPDIVVPVTQDSALGKEDAILEAAEEALQ